MKKEFMDTIAIDLKSAVAGRLFTPQVSRSRPAVYSSSRPYIFASEFDLFQRRSLEDTFETHLI